MKRLLQNRGTLLCFVLLALAGSTATIAAPLSSIHEVRHQSGIALIGSGVYQPHPANEDQAKALHDARRMARANPKDLAYPWIDDSGVLAQRYVNPKGLGVSKTLNTAIQGREERAARSYQQLEQIRSEVTMLTKVGVPGADAIWRVSPDYRNNRMILTVKLLDNKLMTALAEIFGTQAIAVRVQPIAQLPRLMVGRQSDSYPFSGGAKFYTDSPINSFDGWCTLGFAWTAGYVTAGHCFPAGGQAKSPTYFGIGTVASGTEENYDYGDGTVPFPGSTEWIGDMALIRTTATRNAQIFVGNKDSNIRLDVLGKVGHSPWQGDKFCTGGSYSGELCDWEVIETDISYLADGAGGWVNHVAMGHRLSTTGTIPGDSGGPAYVKYSNGVKAVGIISGGYSVWPAGSYTYFTDIWDFEDNLPGFLLTQSTPRPYYLVNGKSNKCLAIWDNKNDDGIDATQWTCTDSQSQSWYLQPIPGTPWSFIKNGSGKCLSVDNNNPENLALIHQWTCYESSPLLSQRWIVNADRTISNGYGKCLSVHSSSVLNGAPIIQYSCATGPTPAPAQEWTWVQIN